MYVCHNIGPIVIKVTLYMQTLVIKRTYVIKPKFPKVRKAFNCKILNLSQLSNHKTSDISRSSMTKDL